MGSRVCKSQQTSMGHLHTPLLLWTRMRMHCIHLHPLNLLEKCRYLRILTRIQHHPQSVPRLPLHQNQSMSKSTSQHHHQRCSDALHGIGEYHHTPGTSMAKTGTQYSSTKMFSGCASGKTWWETVRAQ